jgi:hypothetical protein
MAPGGLKKRSAPMNECSSRGAALYKVWCINTTFARGNDEKICCCVLNPLWLFDCRKAEDLNFQSISRHGEAASSQIPGSIDSYVTEVRE